MVQYSRDLADKICKQLAAGDTLRRVCRATDMPSREAVRLWVMGDHDGFAARYEQARVLGYESMADELLDIADDGTNDWTPDEDVVRVNGDHIARSRLRVDTRKWLLSKALPKVYGEKIAVAGDPENPVQVHSTVETKPSLDQFVAEFMAKRTVAQG